jgi:hypothetical protein
VTEQAVLVMEKAALECSQLMLDEERRNVEAAGRTAASKEAAAATAAIAAQTSIDSARLKESQVATLRAVTCTRAVNKEIPQVQFCV